MASIIREFLYLNNEHGNSTADAVVTSDETTSTSNSDAIFFDLKNASASRPVNFSEPQAQESHHLPTACTSTAQLNRITNRQRLSWVKYENDDNLQGVVQFTCMWDGCTAVLPDSHTSIHDHVTEHMMSYLSACGLSRSDIDNPCTSDTRTFVCPVDACDCVCTGVSGFRIHIGIHIYHATVQRAGLIQIWRRSELRDTQKCPAEPVLSLTSSGGDVFRCGFGDCVMGFYDVLQFFNHVNQHVSNSVSDRVKVDGKPTNVFFCIWKGCQHQFSTKSKLRQHVRHHSGEKECACPFCGAFFATFTNLSDHLFRKETGDFLCCYCKKKFSKEHLLAIHCQKHMSTTQCPICSVVLKSQHDLRRHINRVHDSARATVSCTVCERLLSGPEELEKHMAVHRPPSLECETCQKKFRWKKQLVEHQRTHDENMVPNPYVCHICDSRYSTGTTLGKHFKKKHHLPIPKGFSRFQFKRCDDGLFRLQTSQLLNGPLAEQVLSGKQII